MIFREMRRSLVVASAIVAVTIVGSGAVSAAMTPRAPTTTALVQQMLAAPDPQQAYVALPSAERARVTAALKVAAGTFTTTTVASRTGRLTDAQARTLNLTPPTSFALSAVPTGIAISAAASSGCWYHYAFQSWSEAWPFGHEGNTWMQLNWCSRGGSITSYSISNYGGQGDGIIDYDGVEGTGHLNVGWEVRGYVEFHFALADVENEYPCMQIRGGATGLYSAPQKTCDLN